MGQAGSGPRAFTKLTLKTIKNGYGLGGGARISSSRRLIAAGSSSLPGRSKKAPASLGSRLGEVESREIGDAGRLLGLARTGQRNDWPTAFTRHIHTGAKS